MPQMYTYKGDRLTDAKYKNALCEAVLQPNGKCITCKMAKMLVRFVANGEQVIVLRRLLRKVK